MSNRLKFLNSRIQEGKILHQNPRRWPDVLKWYDEIKALRGEDDRQAFERMHNLENVRTASVLYKEMVDNPSAASIENMKLLVQQSIQHLQRLKKDCKSEAIVLQSYPQSVSKVSKPYIENDGDCVEKIKKRFYNHPIIAPVIFFAILLIGLQHFYGALSWVYQEGTSLLGINKIKDNVVLNKPIIRMIGLGFINDSELMVRLENSGGSDLSSQAMMRVGLVPFVGNTPMKDNISWIKPKNESGISAGKSQSFAFNISPDQKKLIIARATFAVIIIQNDQLVDGVASDIGYTWDSGQSWARYWENVGNVDINQGRQIEHFVDEIKACTNEHAKDKEYAHCFS